MYLPNIKNMWRDVASHVKTTPFIRSKLLNSDPIPLEQAIEIFKALAAREDLLFDRIVGGCEARTHLICDYLMEIGLKPYKAWALSESYINGGYDPKSFINNGSEPKCWKSLHFVLPDGVRIGEKYRWEFHVAPALLVQLSSNVVLYLVIDPGLYDGLVPHKQWGKDLGAPMHGVTVEPYGQIPSECFGSYNTRAQPRGTDLKALSLARLEEVKKHPLIRHRVFPSPFPV